MNFCILLVHVYFCRLLDTFHFSFRSLASPFDCLLKFQQQNNILLPKYNFSRRFIHAAPNTWDGANPFDAAEFIDPLPFVEQLLKEDETRISCFVLPSMINHPQAGEGLYSSMNNFVPKKLSCLCAVIMLNVCLFLRYRCFFQPAFHFCQIFRGPCFCVGF